MIVVDDCIPSPTHDSPELWPLLLCKALLKLAQHTATDALPPVVHLLTGRHVERAPVPAALPTFEWLLQRTSQPHTSCGLLLDPDGISSTPGWELLTTTSRPHLHLHRLQEVLHPSHPPLRLALVSSTALRWTGAYSWADADRWTLALQHTLQASPRRELARLERALADPSPALFTSWVPFAALAPALDQLLLYTHIAHLPTALDVPLGSPHAPDLLRDAANSPRPQSSMARRRRPPQPRRGGSDSPDTLRAAHDSSAPSPQRLCLGVFLFNW